MEPNSLIHAIAFTAAGLAALGGGGEMLVRGAVNASRLLRVSQVVIGLTVVALATSLPELAVSLLAAFRGSPDVAVGNVVGSNMFNIAAIVGLSALIFPPLRLGSPKSLMDVGVMILAAVLTVALGWNGWLGPAEGAVLLAGLAGFLWIRIRGARDKADLLETDAKVALEVHGGTPRGIIMSVLWISLGAGLLTLGAELLVRGAIFIATEKGVSERVIAITLVSAGTGLPELATSIVAGIRRHTSVAMGNVIGSNIFNLFGILGSVALVHPIPASAELIRQDALWMLGISLLALIPVLKRGRTVTRLEGAALLAVYAGYLLWLFRS